MELVKYKRPFEYIILSDNNTLYFWEINLLLIRNNLLVRSVIQ